MTIYVILCTLYVRMTHVMCVCTYVWSGGHSDDRKMSRESPNLGKYLSEKIAGGKRVDSNFIQSS